MSTCNLQQRVEQFLYREARLLDDRQWDDWLACYHPQVEYWMPAWADDDRQTTDPHSEISLIYYANREGLEDRVYRIKTERSAASSMPEPRTVHLISNVELLSSGAEQAEVNYHWATFYHRYNHTDTYFGSTRLWIDLTGEALQIKRKKIRLDNDYINHVIDIYHL